MAYNPFVVDQSAGRALAQGVGGLLSGIAERNLAEQQKDEQMAAQQQMQQDIQMALDSGDPLMISNAMLQYPEAQKMIEGAQGLRNEATKQKRIESLMRIRRGEPVDQVVAETADFITQQGGTPTETMAFANLSPEEARRVTDEQLALLLPPDQFKNLMAASGQAVASSQDGRTAGMKDFDYFQQLKKSDPEAARAFGQERGFITKEGRELSGHMQKRLSLATDEAIEAENNVGQYNVIADDIESADIGGGLFGATWKEGLKEITGTQDAVSDLRRKYKGIRASQVVNNLPPGAASDKDIEMAMGGFPSDKASGAQIASFMRGLAKLEQIRADYANFRSEYISDNGSERGMLKAWKDQQPKQSQPQASIDDLVSKYAD